mgnify:CR=1 FL=1
MVTLPRPWALCPASALAAVAGVFTDIDDTLTRHGAIEPAALSALQALAAAGVPVVAITGRPLGWSEPFARDWPLAAIVPENGAVALIRDGAAVITEYAQDEATRAHNAKRLQAVAARWIYVGDSTNDQTMFGHFALSVGVANLRDFAAQLQTWPAFITDGERGDGFAEVAARIIEARR